MSRIQVDYGLALQLGVPQGTYVLESALRSASSEPKKTYFCLGNGERGCNGCGTHQNWLAMNELPDEYRRRLQTDPTFERVDDTECILRGRPYYTPQPVQSDAKDAEITKLRQQRDELVAAIRNALPFYEDTHKGRKTLRILEAALAKIEGSAK